MNTIQLFIYNHKTLVMNFMILLLLISLLYLHRDDIFFYILRYISSIISKNTFDPLEEIQVTSLTPEEIKLLIKKNEELIEMLNKLQWDYNFLLGFIISMIVILFIKSFF